MSKFKRVAETQEIPDYIEKQIAPQAFEQEDLYGHLKASARRHREVIARETLGEHTNEDFSAKEWERLTQAAVYSQPGMVNPDGEMNPFGLSANTVRRAGYDVDEGENTRPGIYGEIKLQSEDDVWAMAMRGESMFGDEQEEIEKYFVESQKRNSKAAVFESAMDRERKTAERRAAWEAKQMNTLRPVKKALGRANAVVRNSIENVCDSKFGMPDMMAIEENERQRLAMVDAKRERELAIKRNGAAPEDKRALWENDENTRAKTYQQHKADWLDNMDLGEIEF